jgi:hypothetical protein
MAGFAKSLASPQSQLCRFHDSVIGHKPTLAGGTSKTIPNDNGRVNSLPGGGEMSNAESVMANIFLPNSFFCQMAFGLGRICAPLAPYPPLLLT